MSGGEQSRQRLRRLLREEQPPLETPTPAKAETSASPPPWLRARLGARARPGSPEAGEVHAHWTPRLGPPDELVEETGPHGSWSARVQRFAVDHLHGDWRLDEVDHANARTVQLVTGDPALAGLDPRRAVCLDTETTGLSGGAGTWVYMIGLGRFTPEGDYEVWQGFLHGPEEERALLEEVARRVSSAESLISFFGKSFDRHRLEDKMRLAGVEPPFAELPHLDLFHPLRRLHVGAFQDNRLATMERELCGLVREHDLPGSQAPAAWFDYLGGRPHRLEGVFHHNLLDVLSLVTLTAWLGRVERGTRADGRPLPGPQAPRRRALVRSASAIGEPLRALSLAEAAIADEPEARDLLLARAELLRRQRRTAEARECFEWLLAAPDDRWTAPVAVSYAKLLEHLVRDRASALEVARRGALALREVPLGADARRWTRDLDGRIQRLERK